MGELTRVAVDFDTSHLIFPTLIAIVLLLLAAAIAITRWRRIAGAVPYWRGVLAGMDRLRFFGTIALTVLYFSLMVPVGNVWPNTGMGFLLCSIPYIFLTGLLFMHDRRPRRLLPVIAMTAIAPLFAWWLFTDLFFLTLP